MSPPDPTSNFKHQYRIAILSPPGASVRTAKPSADSSDQVGSTAPSVFHDAVSVRVEVFVGEQKCDPQLEIDEADERSWHWVLYARESEDSPEIPAATIRLVPPSKEADSTDHGSEPHPGSPTENGEPFHHGSLLWDKKEPYAMIGRLATVKSCRGRNYARVLMNTLLDWASEHRAEVGEEWHGLILAHAQQYLEKWYGSFGLQVDEGLGNWWEEGLFHVGMWKRPE